jgi:hypothetical protein
LAGQSGSLCLDGPACGGLPRSGDVPSVRNRDAAGWWVVRTRLGLTVACVAFFMVILDTTVVNFPLPAIDHGADRSRR